MNVRYANIDCNEKFQNQRLITNEIFIDFIENTVTGPRVKKRVLVPRFILSGNSGLYVVSVLRNWYDNGKSIQKSVDLPIAKKA